ncbi:MAG TPA: sodium-dependent transporter, partial [Spirochaetaceae bacterium]|nr:sodium-dependent transporter [Spirochaetaceae bacterium]
MDDKNRMSFSGRLGYVLAAAGSAVGLGNIWRFPYLAAKYGGGIFLLCYMILVALVGCVFVISETALGRMTRKSPIGAFATFGEGPFFGIGGCLNALVPMIIVPYYSVIGGWVLK